MIIYIISIDNIHYLLYNKSITATIYYLNSYIMKNTRKSFYDLKLWNNIKKWNNFTIARVCWHRLQWKIVTNNLQETEKDFYIVSRRDYEAKQTFFYKEDLWDFLKKLTQ